MRHKQMAVLAPMLFFICILMNDARISATIKNISEVKEALEVSDNGIKELELIVKDLLERLQILYIQNIRLFETLEKCKCQHQCYFAGKMYLQDYRWEIDSCTFCKCKEGNSFCYIDESKPECVDPCYLLPCFNGATCLGLPGHRNFSCQCPDGYGGDYCTNVLSVNKPVNRMLGCDYEGMPFNNGDFFTPMSNPCLDCNCMMNIVRCNPKKCSQVSCINPVHPLGACCKRCIEPTACIQNGLTYFNGEMWLSADGCHKCVCHGTIVSCSGRPCSPLKCPNQITPPGFCCPICQGCFDKDNNYHENSQQWLSPEDNCEICRCTEGKLYCDIIQCSSLCTHPVSNHEKCCPDCNACLYSGLQYGNGSIITSTNPCENCLCINGSKNCKSMVCQPIKCPFPSFVDNQCCSTCINTGCTYQENIFNHGELILDDKFQCSTCYCQDGVVICEDIICPPIFCPNPIFSEKKCCPSCDICVMNGVHYKNNEIWILHNNSCIQCTCKNGIVIYQSLVCPQLDCYNPESTFNQCCQHCRDLSCFYDGSMYKLNEKFVIDECTICECKEGEIYCLTEKCLPVTCNSDEIPTLKPGFCCPICYPKPATCIAFGDPHYQTFDGKMIHYQGICKYILAMDCKEEDFRIEVKNSDRGLKSVSWTQETTIKIGEVIIDLDQTNLVKVNGTIVTLPYLNRPFIYIERIGSAILINSFFGLKVLWDGNNYIEVSVPNMYKNKVCGLCGNYNNYPQDDMIMKNGQIASSDTAFGNSWMISSNLTCPLAESENPCSRAGYLVLKNANLKCNILKSAKFEPCHHLITPEPYFASCVYDMCACGKDESCLCDILSVYARKCNLAGVKLKWRTSSLCAISCPEERGLIFDECGPACPKSCTNKNIPSSILSSQCTKTCSLPGCQCKADKVLFNGYCIDPNECPSFSFIT